MSYGDWLKNFQLSGTAKLMKSLLAQAQVASSSAATSAQQAASESVAAVGIANNALSVANGIDTKAQTALDNSSAAVSTATAAAKTANDAASTANGIDAKATQAQSDAANAVSTANNAQTNADSAFLTAENAQTSANNAVTTANAAMQKGANLSDVADKAAARSSLGAQGKILLSEVVLTGQATPTGGVDFDGLFTPEFYAYEIEIDGWRCSVDTAHSCFLRWKRNGAVQAANGYWYTWQWCNVAGQTGVVGNNTTNAVLIQLLNGQGGEQSDMMRGQSGRIRLSNPLDTTTSKQVTWEIAGVNGPGGLAFYRGGGFWAADGNSFSGVQLAKDSGVQTTKGRFRLYGIR